MPDLPKVTKPTDSPMNRPPMQPQSTPKPPVGAGPQPNQNAMLHANQNARFKRGPIKPGSQNALKHPMAFHVQGMSAAQRAAEIAKAKGFDANSEQYQKILGRVTKRFQARGQNPNGPNPKPRVKNPNQKVNVAIDASKKPLGGAYGR